MRPWGCTSCGSDGRSPVIETGYDTDGYPVRRRRCEACNVVWETEEVPLTPGTYWSRAASRNVARRARQRGLPMVCKKCGGNYTSGYWRSHVRLSKQHGEALAPPKNGSKKPQDYIRRLNTQSKQRMRAA